MNNIDAWGQYKSYTKDITELCRKLGFAGSGICWVLKLPNGTFTSLVLWALAFFVLFFVADILQSLVGAILTRVWIRREEIKKWRETQSLDGEYLKPAWIDYPSFLLFLLKVILILVGFSFISFEILSR